MLLIADASLPFLLLQPGWCLHDRCGSACIRCRWQGVVAAEAQLESSPPPIPRKILEVFCLTSRMRGAHTQTAA